MSGEMMWSSKRILNSACLLLRSCMMQLVAVFGGCTHESWRDIWIRNTSVTHSYPFKGFWIFFFLPRMPCRFLPVKPSFLFSHNFTSSDCIRNVCLRKAMLCQQAKLTILFASNANHTVWRACQSRINSFLLCMHSIWGIQIQTPYFMSKWTGELFTQEC